jgi:hypothetical protein
MSFDYRKSRYWYHLSDSLCENEVRIIPEERTTRRGGGEPPGSRFCVCPSIPHCLTAVCWGLRFYVYRSKEKVRATKPYNISDSYITHEGWILKPTTFIRLGTLTISPKNAMNHFSASVDPQEAARTLQFWKKAMRDKSIEVRKEPTYYVLPADYSPQ